MTPPAQPVPPGDSRGFFHFPLKTIVTAAWSAGLLYGVHVHVQAEVRNSNAWRVSSTRSPPLHQSNASSLEERPIITCWSCSIYRWPF